MAQVLACMALVSASTSAIRIDDKTVLRDRLGNEEVNHTLFALGEVDGRHATFAQVRSIRRRAARAVESRAVISVMGLGWAVSGGLARFRAHRAYRRLPASPHDTGGCVPATPADRVSMGTHRDLPPLVRVLRTGRSMSVRAKGTCWETGRVGLRPH